MNGLTASFREEHPRMPSRHTPIRRLSSSDRVDVRQAARAVLERAWRPSGYTAPNLGRYRWMWTSDSAFHAIAWAHLGDNARALEELRSIFRWQTRRGFVPHMGYQDDPCHHADFWGRRGASTITQQPVYGHAVAELRRLGIPVPDELVARARAGVRWLLDHRRADGRILLAHPWETGSDDSPEWDAWCPEGYEPARWLEAKLSLVRSLRLDDEGAAIGNRSFVASSVGFDALTAFAAAELGIDDHGIHVAAPDKPTVLTDLLVALVEPTMAPDLLTMALDDEQFGGRFGPAGVHRASPTFAPGMIWRGTSWPQLTYLLWVAARNAGLGAEAAELGSRMVRGAIASSYAECWHPDSGEDIGAAPQSWSAIVVATLTDQQPARGARGLGASGCDHR